LLEGLGEIDFWRDHAALEYTRFTAERMRPATVTRVCPLPASLVSTSGTAGPLAAVVTVPLSTTAADAGSSTTRAGAPAEVAGVMVTVTTLPLSEAADEGARKAAESFFCSKAGARVVLSKALVSMTSPPRTLRNPVAARLAASPFRSCVDSVGSPEVFT
jgi:hypothetical protein